MSRTLYPHDLIQRKVNRQKVSRFLTLLAALSFTLPALARLSPMGTSPEWSQLDKFQKTITRKRFGQLLQSYYAPNGAGSEYIRLDDDAALIRKNPGEGFYRFEFAANDTIKREVPVLWSPVMPGFLAGRKIALDPGHLGGSWAKMEERWFQIGNSKPVTEGDMTLLVARKIVEKLRDTDAIVTLLRDTAEPLTQERPANLETAAAKVLKENGVANVRAKYDGPNDAKKENSIQWSAERLFYRMSEIRARAQHNNEDLRPDLTICLHFNAEPWGDPANPMLTDKNSMHLLVNGNYSSEELAYDDVRFEMLRKLLTQSVSTELNLSENVARHLKSATHLPPYEYTTPNAVRAAGSEYVWMRNLLANRLYTNPTLYLEPYIMNNQQVFERIQLGDYEGTKLVNDEQRKSIYNEYADAVVDALLDRK